jgi:hypothetical protein
MRDKFLIYNKMKNEAEKIDNQKGNGVLLCVSGSVFFTTEEVKDLKRVRNYFGEHDKTLFEHWAYSYLDNILKRIHTDR